MDTARMALAPSLACKHWSMVQPDVIRKYRTNNNTRQTSRCEMNWNDVYDVNMYSNAKAFSAKSRNIPLWHTLIFEEFWRCALKKVILPVANILLADFAPWDSPNRSVFRPAFEPGKGPCLTEQEVRVNASCGTSWTPVTHDTRTYQVGRASWYATLHYTIFRGQGLKWTSAKGHRTMDPSSGLPNHEVIKLSLESDVFALQLWPRV
jgi:hypothetical protein